MDIFAVTLHGWCIELLSPPERLALTVQDFNQPAYLDMTGGNPRYHSLFSHEYFGDFDSIPSRTDRDLKYYLISSHYHPWLYWGYKWRGFGTYSVVWDAYQDPSFRKWGDPRNAWDTLGTFGRGFYIPTWFGAVFFILPTVLLLVKRAVNRLRRPRPGYCAQCGYDLRGTPARCPECGTVALRPANSQK